MKTNKINKKIISWLALSIIAAPALFAAAIYQPGETLDPTCAPGTTDCTVAQADASNWYTYAAWAAVDMANNVINNLASPVAGTDATNKDYVDAAVAAAWGGGSDVTPGSNVTAISDVSWTAMNRWAASSYCYALTEWGFSDWRVPTFDEITYARDVLSDTSWGEVNDIAYLWTRTASPTTTSSWATFRPNVGYWTSTATSTTTSVRCVR